MRRVGHAGVGMLSLALGVGSIAIALIAATRDKPTR